MKIKSILILLLLCGTIVLGQESEKQKINNVLDAWHKAAAKADFDAYFIK